MDADNVKNEKHWNHRWTQMNTDNSNLKRQLAGVFIRVYLCLSVVNS